jgi:hypothetical protein
MKLANALCRFVEIARDQARLPVQEQLPLGA